MDNLKPWAVQLYPAEGRYQTMTAAGRITVEYWQTNCLTDSLI